MELNVHFDALGLDRVFAPGVVRMLWFYRLPPPMDADVARLVTAIRITSAGLLALAALRSV